MLWIVNTILGFYKQNNKQDHSSKKMISRDNQVTATAKKGLLVMPSVRDNGTCPSKEEVKNPFAIHGHE